MLHIIKWICRGGARPLRRSYLDQQWRTQYVIGERIQYIACSFLILFLYPVSLGFVFLLSSIKKGQFYLRLQRNRGVFPVVKKKHIHVDDILDLYCSLGGARRKWEACLSIITTVGKSYVSKYYYSRIVANGKLLERISCHKNRYRFYTMGDFKFGVHTGVYCTKCTLNTSVNINFEITQCTLSVRSH
jgi:hypothetical protein